MTAPLRTAFLSVLPFCLLACSGDETSEQALVRGLELTPTGPKTNDLLNCSWTSIDGASSAVVRWRVNGATVFGETGETLDPEWTKKGDKVSCVVTPELPGAEGERSNIVTILNSAPVLLEASLTPEDPTERDLLYASGEGEDIDREDQDKVFMHYKWMVNGQEVGYDEYVLGPSWWNEGDNVSVYVSVGDGLERSPAQLVGPVTVLNSLPGPPEIEILENGDGSLSCEIVEEAEELDVEDSVEYDTIWREFGTILQEGDTTLDASLLRPGGEYSCEMWASDEEGAGESAFDHFVLDGDVVRYRWAFNDAGASAGSEVHALDDLDGDGRSELLVSTPGVTGQKVEIGGAVVLASSSLSDESHLGDASIIGQVMGSQAHGFLGESIGTTPDFDGDGLPEILLSSPVYPVFGEEVGLAVAVGSTQFLGETTFLFNAEGPDFPGVGIVRGGAAGEGVGRSVLGLDIDGDGLGDMLVSAHSDEVSEPGYVRVFSGVHLAAGGPLYIEHTNASIDGLPGGFGQKMASIPDVGGDGLSELVFTAPRLNNDDGAVLILDSSDLNVYDGVDNIQSTSIPNVGIRVSGSSAEGLGTAIAGGSWNGQGAVLIGAAAASSGAGKAYLLTPNSTSTLDDAVAFEAVDPIAFGHSLDFVGDTNGDGQDEIAIGAPYDSESFDQAGAVFFFNLDELEPGVSYGVDDAFRVIHGEASEQKSGSAVHGAGDLNGDGQEDVVLGASGMDALEGWNEGGVFIWLRP